MMAEVVEEVEESEGDIPEKDDVFDKATETGETAEVAEDSEDEPEVAEVAEEKPEEKPVETEDGASADPKDKVIAGLKATIAGERGRRQKAEKELKGKAEPAPDPAVDPEGFTLHNARQAETIALTNKIELSQDLMRDSHDDFDEMEAVFLSLVSESDEEGNLSVTDSALHEKFLSAPNPSKFAYQHALKHLKFVEVNSDEFETNQKNQIELKAQVRLKELLKERGLEAPDLPDLTNATASESNTEELLPTEGEDNDMF